MLKTLALFTVASLALADSVPLEKPVRQLTDLNSWAIQGDYNFNEPDQDADTCSRSDFDFVKICSVGDDYYFIYEGPTPLSTHNPMAPPPMNPPPHGPPPPPHAPASEPSVPEPATDVMLGLALVGLAVYGSRRG